VDGCGLSDSLFRSGYKVVTTCSPRNFDVGRPIIQAVCHMKTTDSLTVRQIPRRRSGFRLQRLGLQQEDQRTHQRQPRPGLRLHRRRRLVENLHGSSVFQRRQDRLSLAGLSRKLEDQRHERGMLSLIRLQVFRSFSLGPHSHSRGLLTQHFLR